MGAQMDNPLDGRRAIVPPSSKPSPAPWVGSPLGAGTLIASATGSAIAVFYGPSVNPSSVADISLARAAPALLQYARIGLRSLEAEWMKILNNRPNLSDEGYRRLKAEPVVVKLLADIAEATAAIAAAEGR